MTPEELDAIEKRCPKGRYVPVLVGEVRRLRVALTEALNIVRFYEPDYPRGIEKRLADALNPPKETHVKAKKKVTTEVDVKVVRVHAKPCDSGTYELVGASGEVVARREGYVPDFFPGDHYGDYLILDIDLETGQILNWKPPKQSAIEAFIRDRDGEDDA